MPKWLSRCTEALTDNSIQHPAPWRLGRSQDVMSQKIARKICWSTVRGAKTELQRLSLGGSWPDRVPRTAVPYLAHLRCGHSQWGETYLGDHRLSCSVSHPGRRDTGSGRSLQKGRAPSKSPSNRGFGGPSSSHRRWGHPRSEVALATAGNLQLKTSSPSPLLLSVPPDTARNVQ